MRQEKEVIQGQASEAPQGKKRGCKPKWRKKDFKPSTMKGYG